jgi:hypothetical protein
VDGDSASIFFMTLACEAGLIGGFVPAEAAAEGLVAFFFSAEMEERGLVRLFPAEFEDVADPAAGALLVFCCFATDFRFLILNFLSELLLLHNPLARLRLGWSIPCRSCPFTRAAYPALLRWAR